MRNIKTRTPDGTRDLLFSECASLKSTENIITGIFEKHGYNGIMTPGIEYYDLFDARMSGIPQQDLYKMTGPDGRLLVLRPDSTLPIARMVSTRLKDAEMPLRLYYTQSVFRISPALSGNMDEIVQSGAEMIGLAGAEGDYEIVSLAVESLKSLRIGKFRIELGHAGFYKALASALPFDDDKKEEIRLLIESKNYASLGILLDETENTPAVEAIRRLPRLFGGAEVFAEASRLCEGNEVAAECLAGLRETYDRLCECGCGDCVTIDLGLVHRNDYYTGLVFRGYTEGTGLTVLSGGRYDNLLSHFGMPCPATGFAVDISTIALSCIDNK